MEGQWWHMVEYREHGSATVLSVIWNLLSFFYCVAGVWVIGYDVL